MSASHQWLRKWVCERQWKSSRRSGGSCGPDMHRLHGDACTEWYGPVHSFSVSVTQKYTGRGSGIVIATGTETEFGVIFSMMQDVSVYNLQELSIQ